MADGSAATGRSSKCSPTLPVRVEAAARSALLRSQPGNLLIYAAFLTAFMLLVIGMLLGKWTTAVGGVLGGCGVLLFEGGRNVKQRETGGRASTWRWWPNKID